ncbi:3-methyladenine DNA glycosylase [Arthrobacter sp. ISL-48]|uniref:3-methyladenine DNA glycosylase n=1 Tax=Arthrobacter sp. ISL-48 TaxID=2819110 RepID=UPI001BE593F5|nr:3-methyladenine DNA glycosylase [Arthrobacter sp. ISL-48]MBT2531185.1 3-methyladenine DNA glycosylase [Arthrobacter sp. ISL-48]
MSPVEQLSLLAPDGWTAREAAHHERVRRYADPYLARRSAGRKHPVEDFLFTYYTQKPGQLLRWHPGAGVVLSGREASARSGWKHYRTLDGGELASLGLPAGTTAVTFDRRAFLADRHQAVAFAAIILRGTAARPAQFGCFGLHEWAMVYRQDKFDLRHEYLHLRLGSAGTDKVVEDNRIRCSHFDAFRFYTPDAVPRNELTPSRENQRDLEQPGCLHANMDLYKWAYKLLPALPSELVMDCFELSWRIRAMDMQASPYDLEDWGYPAIRIETPEGKAAYVEHQRAFAAEAAELRDRLARELAPLTAAPAPGTGTGVEGGEGE